MRRPLIFLLLMTASCGKTERSDMTTPGEIIASNAFFYYYDLEAAAEFYGQILGLDLVADYGFARIFRVATTSYLTVVSAEAGMHSTDEPKSVAIALITDELEAWYEYLRERDVPMRGELKVEEGSAHDGFVAYDPEGYYLEFERFNPHAENEKLLPVLDDLQSSYTEKGPAELGFKATVLWLYYEDLGWIQQFYEESMGFELMVDQGWAKIYPTSKSGFLGLVDGERGMHQATNESAVTVSFVTDDIDAWFEHMQRQEALERLELRHDEIQDEGFVRALVGYDPENYFFELDQFVEHEDNAELLRALADR